MKGAARFQKGGSKYMPFSELGLNRTNTAVFSDKPCITGAFKNGK
jgi:hypothetical protein